MKKNRAVVAFGTSETIVCWTGLSTLLIRLLRHIYSMFYPQRPREWFCQSSQQSTAVFKSQQKENLGTYWNVQSPASLNIFTAIYYLFVTRRKRKSCSSGGSYHTHLILGVFRRLCCYLLYCMHIILVYAYACNLPAGSFISYLWCIKAKNVFTFLTFILKRAEYKSNWKITKCCPMKAFCFIEASYSLFGTIKNVIIK